MAIDPRDSHCAYRSLSLQGAIGRFGVAYTRKVCAQAHIGFDETSPGEDSLALDGQINFDIASVRVQIKGTTKWKVSETRSPLSFPIEPGWRDKWILQRVPAFIIVVLMDRNVAEWSQAKTKGTLLKANAIWARIDDIDPAATAVSLYRENRFAVETINEWGDVLYSAYGMPARTA